MLYFKRLPIAAFALLPLAVTATVSAATQTDQLVVTATRMAQTIDQSLVPVSVLTREDIDRSPATSLPELLGQLPGVDFSHNGGHGKTASLFIRGTNSDHILVLIDGIRSGSATLGSFAFEQIPLAQIERVELVRGPRSSLYGAEAIGGVLQIFTRKGGEGLSADAHISSGSQGTREAVTSIRVGDEKTRLGVNIGYFKTDGIDAKVGGNPDKDGYDNRSLGLNLEHVISDTVRAELHFMHAESENHYDDQLNADDYADNLQQTLGLRLTNEISEALTISGGVNQFKDQSEAFDSWPSDIKTRRRGADLKGDLYLDAEQLLSIGADYYSENVSNSTTTFTKDSRHNSAFFAQWQNSFGALSVLAGARSDNSSSYGRHNTANLNLGYEVAAEHRLLVSYGTAFKAPTFNDLYYPWGGNPDLKPEESRSFEVGYEGSVRKLDYGLRVYRTEIDNLIEWRPLNDGSDNWAPRNIDPVIKGVEFEIGAQYSGWIWSTQATLLDTDDRKNGGRLIDRAEQSLKFDVGRAYRAFDWTMTFAAYGDRETVSGDKLGGYGVVNFNTRYRIDSNWSVGAKLTNILDKDYATTSAYNVLDRAAMLTLSYSR